MATIYQKTVSDKMCILAPREFILRPFNFLTDWTEMRFGFYFDGVASSGDNTDVSTESVVLSSSSDRIAIGLKNSDTNDIPGATGSLFVGIMTATGLQSVCTGSGSSFGSNGVSGQLSGGAYHDTTLVGGTTSEYLGGSSKMGFPSASSGATGYNGFFVIKFIINNLGTSSQSFTISVASTASISGTDYSAQALRLLMNSGTFDTPATVAWNDGAVARTIPDAVYIRMPFYSNRFRMSAMRAIRYAP